VALRLTVHDVVRSGPPPTPPFGALLFEWEGRLFRGFRGESAVLFERLLGAAWLPELFDAGLVRFERADVVLEGYSLVVEAERVPVVSYPPEWPVVMLRDAGVLIARLGVQLARHGLGFHDAHPWNVLYDGPRPVFVDLDSIFESREVSTDWSREFRREIVLPLALHRVGLHELAAAIAGTENSRWKARLDRRRFRLFPPGFALLGRHRSDAARYFAALADYVGSLPDMSAKTAWSGCGLDTPQGGEVGRYSEKERSMDQLLREIPRGRVLDVGANAGRYSLLATEHGHTVTAIDTDDRTSGALYLQARARGLPILPLKIDFMWPTGSSGLGLVWPAAPERLRSETVIALAVLHHLVGSQNVTFEAFARVLDMFAADRAIVEFIPRNDIDVAKWPLATVPWYDAGALVTAMAPYFRLVKTMPSSPAPRTILLFARG
jgi:SAM-dependent methyltransferase